MRVVVTNAAQDLTRDLVEAERQAMLCRAAMDAAERRVRRLREQAELATSGPPKTVGTADALRLVKTSRRSLVRDAGSGKIVAEKIGERWQYDRASLLTTYPSR